MFINDLSMSFGNQVLYEHVNLTIPKNSHVGIIGSNGAGKSTFFNIILKKLIPDTGKVVFNEGTHLMWLPQVITEEIPNHDITVYDYLLSARPIEELNNELVRLYTALTNNIDDEKKITKRINQIQNKLDYYEQYQAESILLKILDGMNISNELLNMKLVNLSGGQKSKIAFARLLYSKKEILLLDEPTNHLDVYTKDFVINYLRNWNGLILVISHDLAFLNAITDKTLVINKASKTMELYNGNAEYAKRLMKEHENALVIEADKQEREIEKLKKIVGLYTNSSGKRKRMAQDREKKLNKLLEEQIVIERPTKQTRFQMTSKRTSGVIPLKIENLQFGYDENKLLINDLSLELLRGDKFLIVGENGIGKSTLLKLIIGELTGYKGSIELGVNVDIGYYAQEHELLNEDLSVIDNLGEYHLSNQALRNVLGRFLFTGDSIYKKVKVLSPGERSRVALAKLALSEANFLILDEPTNHLDPETQTIIAETFKTFPGTMLIVSHNPEFVNDLGIDRIVDLSKKEIFYYNEEIVKHYHDINNVKN